LHTHIIIDLKKYGEKLKPFLEEVGVIEKDEFDKQWKKGGYTKEEAKKHLHELIEKLPWKK
jgi:hypothetical protein